MNGFGKVEEFREPSAFFDNFKEKKIEMYPLDIGFLCGLIKDKRPKKIVEVGVAAGGSACLMINCVNMLRIECEMYSVDVSERYYWDANKKTGFMVQELERMGVDHSFHKFLLGKVVAEQLEEIGKDIDFLLLDTTHALPGEVLDFLVLYPYLAKEAIVVLHDTAVHTLLDVSDEIATASLLQAVVAEKFINNDEEYPNIAAFKINEDTEKYLGNVFLSLFAPWKYMLGEKELSAYRREIEKNYSKEFVKLFYQAEQINKDFLARLWRAEVKAYFEQIKDSGYLDGIENIYLYGAGHRGTRFLKCANKFGVSVRGFIISDEANFSEEQVEGLPVKRYASICEEKEGKLLFLTVNSEEVKHRLQTSGMRWREVPEKIWNLIEWADLEKI